MQESTLNPGIDSELKKSVKAEIDALPELPGFAELLDSYQKFGWHCKASQNDLPALREYRDNLARNITGNFHDVFNLLNLGVENDYDFDNAEPIGYTLQNAAERIIALSEIQSFVSSTISALETNATPGEAS